MFTLAMALIVVAALAFVGAGFLATPVSRTARRNLMIAAAVTALGGVACFFVAQPVYDDSAADPTAFVVYLGITDDAIVRAARTWVENRLKPASAAAVTVVGIAEAEPLVRAAWPGAAFTALAVPPTVGVTLEAIVPDIEKRIPGPAVTTAVVVAGPRATNVAEVRARFGQAFEQRPTLPKHLYFLHPGVGQDLPDVGDVTLTADRVLAQGSPAWPVNVTATAGQLSGETFVRGWFHGSNAPAVRGVELRPNAFTLYDEPDAPRTSIPPPAPHKSGGLRSGGRLPPPRGNDPTAVLFELRTAHEPLRATMAFATEQKPQLLVLKKRGADLDPLFPYCKDLGLDVRAVELDLTDPARAAANAEILSDYPVLMVGCPLTAGEWGALKASLAAQKATAALLFAGSGRSSEAPKGWLGEPLAGFQPLVKDGVLRKVGFAWDNSGSMTAKISDADGRSRLEVVRQLIERFKGGFNQRNTGVLEVLVEAAPWQMRPIAEAANYGLGSIEAGSALINFDRIVAAGAPLSDVVIFIDPTDVELDGMFSQAHLDAAQRLEAAGCKIFFVSVGGDMDGNNNRFFLDRLRLKMVDFSGAELDRRVERLIYNDVLPRLTLRFEPAGTAGLQAEHASHVGQQLARVATNPSLRLIDALGGPTNIGTVPEVQRKSVLAWAVHRGDVGTPLLMRQPVPVKDNLSTPVTWLNASINAEAAERLQQDDGDETRKLRAGLADLFIAAVSAASPRMKSSPINFFALADGRRLVAILDTYQPFQVVPEETRLTGTRGVVGTLDDRDLGQLQWEFRARLAPYTTERLEARVTDRDSRIGSATQAIRLFGMPPTLVPPRETQLMTLAHRDDPAKASAAAGLATAPPKGGVPQSWYGILIAAAVLLSAIVIWRT